MRVETGIPMDDWRAVPEAARAAEQAGFDGVVSFEIAHDPFTPLAKQLESIRYRVAFYGSTRSYHGVLEAHGLEDLGMKLHSMSKQGRWNEMAAEIPDDLLPEFTAIATYDDLPTAIEQRFAGLTDAVAIGFDRDTPAGLVREIVSDVQAIATPFDAYPADW